jgi:periplasmic divalent cation tolerance protein
MSDIVLALTTLPGDFDATELAQQLVGTGLAACVSIIPGIRSVYIWQRVDPLWEVIREKHPYDVPEFLVVPVIDGSEEYLHWVDRAIGPRVES